MKDNYSELILMEQRIEGLLICAFHCVNNINACRTDCVSACFNLKTAGQVLIKFDWWCLWRLPHHCTF
jgi:hypothetical protein